MPEASDPYISYIILAAIGAAIIFTNWLFNYSKHKRDEAERFEPRQNPPAVEKFATNQRVDELETRIGERFEKLDDASSKSREKVYNRLLELEKRQASTNTSLDHLGSQLAQMDIKLDNIVLKR